MDKMQMFEAQMICENIGYVDRTQWDATRFLTYMYSLAHAKKGTTLEQTDIMRFVWDGEVKKIEKTPMTAEQREHLEALANKFSKVL